MSAIKLNTHIRGKLLQAMLLKGIEAEEKHVQEMEHLTAETVYKALYKPEDLARINALPDGWLATRTDIRVKIGTSGYNYRSLDFAAPRRFLDSTGECAMALNARDELAGIIEDYIRERDRVMAKKEQLKESLQAVLNSVTTIGRLLEVWPEARVFTESLDLSRPQLPALPIKSLNKQLGIAA